MGPCTGKRGRRAAAAGANTAECHRRRSNSAPPGKRMKELKPLERRVAQARVFTWLAMAELDVRIAMTEDEEEEECRRAEEECRRTGKVHRYDPDNEWKKRVARIARKWPPLDGFFPDIDEYMKLLDDDDDDRDEQEQQIHGPTGHGEELEY